MKFRKFKTLKTHESMTSQNYDIKNYNNYEVKI